MCRLAARIAPAPAWSQLLLGAALLRGALADNCALASGWSATVGTALGSPFCAQNRMSVRNQSYRI